MKREITILTMLELRNLFGFNKFRHSKDKKIQNRYIGLGAVWFLLLLMAVCYVGALSFGLIAIGLAQTVPMYLTLISGLLILAFGLFKAGSMIFSLKGYDLLSSLPLHSDAIVISRFIHMYVTDLLFTLLIMIPGAAVYGVLLKPAIGFYIILFVGIPFIPMLPLVLSLLFGTLVTALASRMKHKTLAQIVLTVLFIVGILALSIFSGSGAEEISPELLSDLANHLSTLIGQLYPPALWFGSAAVSGNVTGLFLFVGISVACALLALWIVAYNFHGISRRLFVTAATHDYRLGTLKTSTRLTALCRREARRYFSSTIYVTNTIVGPIMAVLMAVALCVSGTEAIEKALPMPLDIAGLVPFLLAAVFTMMPPASSSISMEGKEFWIIKTLPVPAKIWIDSKLLFNLILMAPFYVIVEILMIIACRPTGMALLWMLLIPLVLTVFVVVLALAINLKFHSFDWEKEEIVVKQSVSALLGGFCGLFTSLLCAGITLIAPASFCDLVKCTLCAVLILLTALLYRHCCSTKLQKL